MRTRTNLHGWAWSVCFILSLIAGNAFGGGTWDLYDDFDTGSTVDPAKWTETALYTGWPTVTPTITGQKMVFDISQKHTTYMRSGNAVKGIKADVMLTGDTALWYANGGIVLETDTYRAFAWVTSEDGDGRNYVEFKVEGLTFGSELYSLALPAEQGTVYDLGIYHDGTDFCFLYQNRVVASSKGKVALQASTPVDSGVVGVCAWDGVGTLDVSIDNVWLLNQTSAPITFTASTAKISVPEGGEAQFTVDLDTIQGTDVTITPYTMPNGDADLTISAAAQTISAGDTQATFTITSAQDTDWSNGTTSFELCLSDDSRVIVTAVEVDDEHHHEWSIYDDFSGTSLDDTKWIFIPDSTPLSLDTANDKMVIGGSSNTHNGAMMTRTSNVWGIRANMSLSKTVDADPDAGLELAFYTQTHLAKVRLSHEPEYHGAHLSASIISHNYYPSGTGEETELCAATLKGALDQTYAVDILFDGKTFWVEVDGVALLDSRAVVSTAGTLWNTAVGLSVGENGIYTGYVDSVQVYQTMPPVAALSAVTPTNSPSITVTALFNEPVTGFDNLLTDVTVSSGSVDNLVAVSSAEYTFDVTPAEEGDITVTVVADAATAVSDGRGNVSSSMVVTYDITPPAAPSIATIAEDRGASSSDGVTNDQTLMIYGSSDPETVLIEVYLDGSSIGTTTDLNSNGEWTFDYTGTSISEGAYDLTAEATDEAGNTGPASSAFTIDVDLTSPLVTVSTGETEPVSATFAVTATFSESVNGLESSEISVVNGTVLELTGSGATYTFKVKPGKIGKIQVSLPADCAQDIAGNDNEASNTLTVNYVIVIPDDDNGTWYDEDFRVDGDGCALGATNSGLGMLVPLLVLLGTVTLIRFKKIGQD